MTPSHAQLPKDVVAESEVESGAGACKNDVRIRERVVTLTPSRLAVCVFARDTTELHAAQSKLDQANERLRLHVQHSPLAVVECDKDFTVTFWSAGAERLFGWSAPEVLGRPIANLNLVRPEDRPVVESRMNAVTESESRRVVSSNRIVTKGGRVVECAWYNSVLHDANGHIASVMSLVLDMTAPNQAQRRLLELTGRLVDQVEGRAAQVRALAEQIGQIERRERKRIAQVMHDDLAQLVVIAKMKLAVLASTTGDESRKTIQEIDRHLRDALAFTRNMMLNLDPPLLHEKGLGAAVRALAEKLAADHGLRVSVECEEDEKLEDPILDYCFGCVREALANVVKYAQTESAKVVIDITPDGVRLCVEDRGIGFNTDRLARGPDERGGYGLHSARERARLMRGSFDVVSSPGKGTRLQVYLPRCVEKSESKSLLAV